MYSNLLKTFYTILVFSSLISINAYAAWDDKQINNIQNQKITKNNNKKEILANDEIILISDEKMELFLKRYGANAKARLKYIQNIILSLKKASVFEKLYTIDILVNRIHFLPDNKHWKKRDYWATPLEIIGTNYGDTEDMALLKFVLMVKVGLDPNDIKLVRKDTVFKHANRKYSENVSLMYFAKNALKPLVLDYDYRGGDIYKYKHQFNYKIIENTHFKHWKNLFKEDITISEIDQITNNIQTIK